MNKIEEAIEILMAERNLFFCKECERWVYNEDRKYSFTYCERCLKRDEDEKEQNRYLFKNIFVYNNINTINGCNKFINNE